MELCGGIHVKNTGEIWYFKSFQKVAAGFDVSKRLPVIPSKGFASQNALNEIKLENPQDVIKAVVSVQEENVKLKNR
jgi:alanyl-tRNA synthetase